MGISAIENAAGVDRKCYKTGHTSFCFKCQKWVRVLKDNEMCAPCNKALGIKESLEFYGTNSAIEAGNKNIDK